MNRTTIYLDDDQQQYIAEYCQEYGLSFSAWVRLQIAIQRREQQQKEVEKYGFSNIRIGQTAPHGKA